MTMSAASRTTAIQGLLTRFDCHRPGFHDEDNPIVPLDVGSQLEDYTFMLTFIVSGTGKRTPQTSHVQGRPARASDRVRLPAFHTKFILPERSQTWTVHDTIPVTLFLGIVPANP